MFKLEDQLPTICRILALAFSCKYRKYLITKVMSNAQMVNAPPKTRTFYRNVNDHVIADAVFGYPVVKIPFHLRGCPSGKHWYARQFQCNPNKLYIRRKLKK